MKGPLVERYETEILAVKVNGSILLSFREISQSGSILQKEAEDSYFKLIFKLESSRNHNFFRENKKVHLSELNLEILKRVMHQIYTSTGILTSSIKS